MATWQDCIDSVILRDRPVECSDIMDATNGISVYQSATLECDVASKVGSKFVGAQGRLDEIERNNFVHLCDVNYFCKGGVALSTTIPPGSLTTMRK